MRLTFELELGRRREEVWKAFDNPDNIRKWQPTLVGYERVSGLPGQPGSIATLSYREDGRLVVLTEAITLRREPEEFGGSYESDMALNTIHNRFEVVSPWVTRWTVTVDFQFRGLWRLLGWAFRRAIRRRTLTDLERFKTLLEDGAL